MLVRDVLIATSRIGDLDVEALLKVQTRGVQSLRHLGLLVSSRLTPVSWTVIGKVWGGRSRAGAQAAALKAEARIAQKDPAMMAHLSALLRELGAEALPATRPAAAGYRYGRPTILSRIAQHEARIAALRAQLQAHEGPAA